MSTTARLECLFRSDQESRASGPRPMHPCLTPEVIHEHGVLPPETENTPCSERVFLLLHLILVYLLREFQWGHLAGQDQRQQLIKVIDDGP